MGKSAVPNATAAGEDLVKVARHERDDQELLRRFRAGDAVACHQLARWAVEIVRFKGFYVPPGDREDIVQDTLADVWRAVSAPGFELRESLRGLVRKIAAARCIDRHRRLRPMLDLDVNIIDARKTPHEETERRNARLLLRWVLRSLGEGCKQIIALRFYEGLSYGEIADRLGRAEATMRVRMFNCMKEIRHRLAQCEDPFVPGETPSSSPQGPDAATEAIQKRTRARK